MRSSWEGFSGQSPGVPYEIRRSITIRIWAENHQKIIVEFLTFYVQHLTFHIVVFCNTENSNLTTSFRFNVVWLINLRSSWIIWIQFRYWLLLISVSVRLRNFITFDCYWRDDKTTHFILIHVLLCVSIKFRELDFSMFSCNIYPLFRQTPPMCCYLILCNKDSESQNFRSSFSVSKIIFSFVWFDVFDDVCLSAAQLKWESCLNFEKQL